MMNSKNAVSEVAENHDTTAFHYPDLDGFITQGEFLQAVYSRHDSKVPGLDGIIIEMIKLFLHVLEPYPFIIGF